METITQYEAKDGSILNDEFKCRQHEIDLDQVNDYLSILKPTPTECNWEGYVQQESWALNTLRRNLFNMANKEGVLKWWIDNQKNTHGKTEEDLINCHPSWFLRMLDGSRHPISTAYGRLCCIDDQNREWNQPYYANNSDKGKQQEIK